MLAFPPELAIESVIDKSKKFNSESRIKIKNLGKLPAINIFCDVHDGDIRMGPIKLKMTAINTGSTRIHKLSGGESAETSVTPGVHLSEAAQLTTFSYVLRLKYEAKILFFKKKFSKKWKVELRNFEDGFSWNIAPIE
ncbi:hypothetical protein GCM10027318_08540 [Massilia agilis]